jgi:Cellulase (glycosyl hydrolase family 5)
MPRFRLLLSVLAIAILGAATGAGEAAASHGQSVFFEPGTVLLNPKTRPQALSQMQHLGVRAIRVELAWREVAPSPNSRTRPSFEGTNPAAYRWGQYDAALEAAHKLGWQVLLTVTSPVPKWASSTHHDYLTRPDDRDFQEFMTAVGKHYGSEVAVYSIWNEPNHPAFLRPQFSAHRQPLSPTIYRGLFVAGYAGLKAAGLSNPKVLMGETAPTGYDHNTGLHDVAPLAFLRGVLCLNSRYHKSSSCQKLPAYGYAHHAYTTAAGPFYRPPSADDVTIGVLSRLTRALDLAARAHAIRSGMPIYLTEFGVQSKPNRYLGVSPQKQAQDDAIAEKIAWSDSRVAAFSQYLLRDDPLGGPPGSSVHGGFIGFQTGLEYRNGRPKELYQAWPVPLVVNRAGHGYSLWGLIRPTHGATSATVLVRRKGTRRYSRLATVHTNSLGYWSLHSSLAGVSWRVRWVSPTHATYEGPSIPAS